MRAGLLTIALIAAVFLARGVFADFSQASAPHMTYWRSGGPRTSVSMRDGVRAGPASEWYPSGAKLSEGEYVDGLREGPWSYWLEDGSADTERSGTYRIGKRIDG